MSPLNPVYLEPGDLFEVGDTNCLYLICSYAFSVIKGNCDWNHQERSVVHEAILFRDDKLPRLLVVNFGSGSTMQQIQVITRRQSLLPLPQPQQ